MSDDARPENAQPAAARSRLLWGDPEADPELVREHAATRGGEPYAELHRAHRAVNDALAGATLPPEVSARVTGLLTEVAALATAHRARERDRWDALRPDLPGRGSALLPPYVLTHSRDGVLRGHVTFGRFHVGGNHAVHGGVQPLLFDDLLGHVTNADHEGIARTAFLKVDYRAVTPIEVQLDVEATLDRVEGRKRWASGRLFGPDGAVLAEASALFVQMLPGQP